jgi:hypothetical protein
MCYQNPLDFAFNDPNVYLPERSQRAVAERAVGRAPVSTFPPKADPFVDRLPAGFRKV